MIRIFGTESCAGCKQTETFFNYKGLEYKKYDIQSNEAKEYIHSNNLSPTMIPIIDTGQKPIVGYNIGALAKLAHVET